MNERRGVGFKPNPTEKGEQDAKAQLTNEKRAGERTPGLTSKFSLAEGNSRFVAPVSRPPTARRGRLDNAMQDHANNDSIILQPSPRAADSFTSFTSPVWTEVNEINDRRRRGRPLSFTSFTSFSREGGTCVPALARSAGRADLTLPSDWSERSERDTAARTPSGENLVHFVGSLGSEQGEREVNR